MEVLCWQVGTSSAWQMALLLLCLVRLPPERTQVCGFHVTQSSSPHHVPRVGTGRARSPGSSFGWSACRVRLIVVSRVARYTNLIPNRRVPSLGVVQRSRAPGSGAAHLSSLWSWLGHVVSSCGAPNHSLVQQKWVGTHPAVSLDLFRLMSDGEDDE